jgi:cytochrome c oxidase subunit 4
MSEHTQDPKAEAATYTKTLVTLLILTGITVGASYIQFGSGAANVVVALSIATIKATLVALFFMHLLHDKPVNGIIAAAGFLFLGLFLMFCLIDVDTRIDPAGNLTVPTAPAATSTAAPAAPAEHH